MTGTRIDRNMIINRMKLSPTTAAMKIGRRLVTFSDRSITAAVEPPT